MLVILEGKNVNSSWTTFVLFLCYEKQFSKRAREKDVSHAKLTCMFAKKQTHTWIEDKPYLNIC